MIFDTWETSLSFTSTQLFVVEPLPVVFFIAHEECDAFAGALPHLGNFSCLCVLPDVMMDCENYEIDLKIKINDFFVLQRV